MNISPCFQNKVMISSSFAVSFKSYEFITQCKYNNKKLNYFEWLGFVIKQDISEAGVLAKYFVDKGNTYFEIRNNTTTYNRDIIQYIVTELGRAVKYYETNDIITVIL